MTGYDYSTRLYDSTELLVHGASAWTEAGPLPHKTVGLQVVSLDNQVISTGEFIPMLMWLIVQCGKLNFGTIPIR